MSISDPMLSRASSLSSELSTSIKSWIVLFEAIKSLTVSFISTATAASTSMLSVFAWSATVSKTLIRQFDNALLVLLLRTSKFTMYADLVIFRAVNLVLWPRQHTSEHTVRVPKLFFEFKKACNYHVLVFTGTLPLGDFICGADTASAHYIYRREKPNSHISKPATAISRVNILRSSEEMI